MAHSDKETPKLTIDSVERVSRRKALKALAAATGAAAAALPKAWDTPLVNTGAIPAHAQASWCVLPEETLEVDSTAEYTDVTVAGDEYEVIISYNIPLGVAIYDLAFDFLPGGCGGAAEYRPDYSPPNNLHSFAILSGDTVCGTVRLVFYVWSLGTCTSVDVTVNLTDNDNVLFSETANVVL